MALNFKFKLWLASTSDFYLIRLITMIKSYKKSVYTRNSRVIHITRKILFVLGKNISKIYPWCNLFKEYKTDKNQTVFIKCYKGKSFFTTAFTEVAKVSCVPA